MPRFREVLRNSGAPFTFEFTESSHVSKTTVPGAGSVATIFDRDNDILATGQTAVTLKKRQSTSSLLGRHLLGPRDPYGGCSKFDPAVRPRLALPRMRRVWSSRRLNPLQPTGERTSAHRPTLEACDQAPRGRQTLSATAPVPSWQSRIHRNGHSAWLLQLLSV